MEEYNITIMSPAQVDFLDIVEHLNTMPPETAAHNYEQIVSKIKTLAAAPEYNPLAKDAQLRLRGYRTTTANDYTVFYVIKNKAVELRRILYSRRQYECLF